MTIFAFPAAAQQPDLTFSNLVIRDGINPDSTAWRVGSTQTFGVQIANFGAVAADSFKVQFFLSLDTLITINDVSLGAAEQRVGLGVGTTQVFFRSRVVPAVANLGSYYLGAIIDVDDDVGESDEDNNTAFSRTAITVFDFLPPIEVTVEEEANTPFLTVQWGRPEIASAPTIQDLGTPDPGAFCMQPDGADGNIFALSVDYDNDPEGDVLNGNIHLFFEPTIFNAQAELVSAVRVVGDSLFGTVFFDVCVSFGSEEEIILPFHFLDNAGNSSNIESVLLVNPLASKRGGGGIGGAGRFVEPPQPSQTGLELLAYNIYRTPGGRITDKTADEPIATVPATETSYVDEFTEPGASYTYTVTTVYRVGESAMTASASGVATNVNIDNLFERITQGVVFSGTERTFGSAWGDYDPLNGNGFDLFVTNYKQTNVLFQNNGSGTFTRIEMGDNKKSYSASWGDYDNNGTLDLFVANNSYTRRKSGQQDNFLYENNNGVLQPITTGPIVTDGGNSYSGSWADYNKDGLLDLFVANELEENFLYKNMGGGSFRAVTDAGTIVTDNDFSSLGIWGDFDNDGNLDLYVTNLFSRPNRLYRNLGPTMNYAFEDVTGIAGVAGVGSSQGASWGDYNNDGYLDLFVANRENDKKNVLYHNDGDRTFTRYEDVDIMNSGSAVVNDAEDSVGSSWGDYDNDGDLDLLVMNLTVPNALYENDNGFFTRVTGDNIATNTGNSTGGTWADYNNDGGLDMFVANDRGNNLLYLNKKTNTNNVISITCVGTISNRSAIGARVTVTATINGVPIEQVMQISGQTGQGGQNSLSLAFGLGNATEVSRIDVEWPNASRTLTTLTNVAANQAITITEPGLALSGRVTDAAGAPIADVTMTLSGGDMQQTDSNGDYAFEILTVGSYTVTPSKQNYTFDPPSRTFSDLNQDQTAADFTGTPIMAQTYTISGQVADGSGAPIADVTMTLSGDASATQQTDSNGDYAFAGLPEGGDYTVAPSKQDFAFDPLSRTFSNLSQDETAADFTGTSGMQTYTISGRVLDSRNDAFPGVTMTLSGDMSATQQTDSNGDYTFAGVPEGGNYTVTPSRSPTSFNPANRVYNGLTESVTANFGTVVQAATEDSDEVPKQSALYDNYPNPFAGSTTIQFALPKHTYVTLAIYNLLGKEVETVIDGFFPPGEHEATWKAEGLAGGVYLYRFQAGEFVQTRKLVLIK